jgi:hypothetical protein
MTQTMNIGEAITKPAKDFILKKWQETPMYAFPYWHEVGIGAIALIIFLMFFWLWAKFIR